MTQTMDLNKMGLAPMSEFEMEEIDGGRFNCYLVAALVFGAAAILLSDGIATPYVIGMVKAASAVSFTAGMLQY